MEKSIKIYLRGDFKMDEIKKAEEVVEVITETEGTDLVKVAEDYISTKQGIINTKTLMAIPVIVLAGIGGYHVVKGTIIPVAKKLFKSFKRDDITKVETTAEDVSSESET